MNSQLKIENNQGEVLYEGPCFDMNCRIEDYNFLPSRSVVTTYISTSLILNRSLLQTMSETDNFYGRHKIHFSLGTENVVVENAILTSISEQINFDGNGENLTYLSLDWQSVRYYAIITNDLNWINVIDPERPTLSVDWGISSEKQRDYSHRVDWSRLGF